MKALLTGNFQQQDAARRALSNLASAGFSADQMKFFVIPAGQHDFYPIGGDEDESPRTEDAAGRPP